MGLIRFLIRIFSRGKTDKKLKAEIRSARKSLQNTVVVIPEGRVEPAPEKKKGKQKENSQRESKENSVEEKVVGDSVTQMVSSQQQQIVQVASEEEKENSNSNNNNSTRGAKIAATAATTAAEETAGGVGMTRREQPMDLNEITSTLGKAACLNDAETFKRIIDTCSEAEKKKVLFASGSSNLMRLAMFAESNGIVVEIWKQVALVEPPLDDIWRAPKFAKKLQDAWGGESLLHYALQLSLANEKQSFRILEKVVKSCSRNPQLLSVLLEQRVGDESTMDFLCGGFVEQQMQRVLEEKKKTKEPGWLHIHWDDISVSGSSDDDSKEEQLRSVKKEAQRIVWRALTILRQAGVSSKGILYSATLNNSSSIFKKLLKEIAHKMPASDLEKLLNSPLLPLERAKQFAESRRLTIIEALISRKSFQSTEIVACIWKMLSEDDFFFEPGRSGAMLLEAILTFESKFFDRRGEWIPSAAIADSMLSTYEARDTHYWSCNNNNNSNRRCSKLLNELMVDGNGNSLLHRLCGMPKMDAAVLQVLIKHGADVTVTTAFGRSCLSLAVDSGSVDCCEVIRKACNEMEDGLFATILNYKNRDGTSLLHDAVNGSVKKSNNSNTNNFINNNNGTKKNHYHHDDTTLEWILRQPALDISTATAARNSEGESPLHRCALLGNLAGFRLIIGAIEDAAGLSSDARRSTMLLALNDVTKDKETILHLAARSMRNAPSRETHRLLLEEIMSKELFYKSLAENRRGETASDYLHNLGASQACHDVVNSRPDVTELNDVMLAVETPTHPLKLLSYCFVNPFSSWF